VRQTMETRLMNRDSIDLVVERLGQKSLRQFRDWCESTDAVKRLAREAPIIDAELQAGIDDLIQIDENGPAPMLANPRSMSAAALIQGIYAGLVASSECAPPNCPTLETALIALENLEIDPDVYRARAIEDQEDLVATFDRLVAMQPAWEIILRAVWSLANSQNQNRMRVPHFMGPNRDAIRFTFIAGMVAAGVAIPPFAPRAGLDEATIDAVR
jgi:hypothetical protein